MGTAVGTSPSQDFGALLKRYRDAAGLTQEELAERAHISPQAISQLERGVRQTPYPATARLLAEALALAAEDRAAFLACAGRLAHPAAARVRAYCS
jgi:transcriptional regulator with XRE-family HTH domain